MSIGSREPSEAGLPDIVPPGIDTEEAVLVLALLQAESSGALEAAGATRSASEIIAGCDGYSRAGRIEVLSRVIALVREGAER